MKLNKTIKKTKILDDNPSEKTWSFISAICILCTNFIIRKRKKCIETPWYLVTNINIKKIDVHL